ncbi:MAG: septal ring lytic transglycosylase RlpA family protein [Coriobacteriia bacterium]
MIVSAYLKKTLVSFALVGILAAATGVGLGIGAGRSLAGAAPVRVPTGTLGIGSQRVDPLGAGPVSGGVQIIAVRGTAASLTTSSALAKAPIPRPVVRKRSVKPRATRSSAQASAVAASVSAANAGGWKIARASWYGPGFYGRKTASGAVFTQTMRNVAHKSLPFGTRIEFEFRGRKVVAVVNDRGPFVGGRTFDLGAGTAKALGFGGVQTIRYRILGR